MRLNNACRAEVYPAFSFLHLQKKCFLFVSVALGAAVSNRVSLHRFFIVVSFCSFGILMTGYFLPSFFLLFSCVFSFSCWSKSEKKILPSFLLPSRVSFSLLLSSVNPGKEEKVGFLFFSFLSVRLLLCYVLPVERFFVVVMDVWLRERV